MKKLVKLTLALAFVLGSTSLYAQKFGRINMQELIMAMPETTEMNNNLEAYVNDLRENMETIQVEFNNKLNDYQKNYNTLSDSVRQLKEKELQDLQTRMSEFEQIAQQDIQKKQAELLEPIVNKARDAVNKVAKAGGYLAVFDMAMGALAYYDEAALTDLMDGVKAEMGIK